MTEALYYDDAFLQTFTGRVVARAELDGQPAVQLDRTAFYPEGGGQPADTGELNGIAVRDVQRDAEGHIWHRLAAPLDADTVTGRIDWPRRFDHMQQHTGQHILSRAFIEAAEADTVGFHLGIAITTIDLNTDRLAAEAIARAEAAANRIIAENRPVHARFVAPAEVARLPLRRPPKVTENIRVVEVDGYDWSACGGTHVGTTAQVGLLKIVKTEKRGADTRVTFLCGQRALADYQRKHALVQGLAERLTTGEDDVLAAVERLDSERNATFKTLKEAETALAQAEAASLFASAPALDGQWRLVSGVFRGRPAERVKALALHLQQQPGCLALLAWVGPDGHAQVTFVASAGAPHNMGALLRATLQPLGGRGGGRPDYAQGGLPDGSQAEAALAAARARLRQS